MSNTRDCSTHDVDPHVTILPGVHELAANADVGTAEQDHSCGNKRPKHQELLRHLRREVDHDILVVVLVKVAVVGHQGCVVGTISTILGVEVHALHAQGVDTPLHVLEDLDVLEDADVLLEGDHALIDTGLCLNEPPPVLPGLRVHISQMRIISFTYRKKRLRKLISQVIDISLLCVSYTYI